MLQQKKEIEHAKKLKGFNHSLDWNEQKGAFYILYRDNTKSRIMCFDMALSYAQIFDGTICYKDGTILNKKGDDILNA